MEPLLAGWFKDERFSDAYLSIRLRQNNPVDDPAGSEPEELSRFPVHLVILTQSHYFLSQMDFTEHQADTGNPASRSNSVRAADETRGRPRTRSMGRPAAAAARSRSRSLDREAARQQSTPAHPLQRTERCSIDSRRLSSDKPTVVFTIEDRAHEPAVQAVIASMYGVKDALAGLEQQQLVHAAWYADVLQVEQAACKVFDLLKEAAGTDDGLTVASLAALASWPSWPAFMLPLLPELAKHAMNPGSPQAGAAAASSDNARNISLQQVLLSVLGDLESVWNDQDLSKMLLQLPLPAMQLLLSSDKLSVYSEDTVLFTVVTYAKRQARSVRVAVRNLLSDLVRAPHLSHFQLLMQTFDDVGAPIALGRYRRELQQLQSLKHHAVSSADIVRTLEKDVEDIPGSWLLGPRLVMQPPGDGVSVSWSVPISDLKQWCQNCAANRATKNYKSPGCSPPISGVSWRLKLCCVWDTTSNGVTVAVCRTTNGIPNGFFAGIEAFIMAPPHVAPKQLSNRPSKGDCGTRDFFKIGSMANGWDESAWVSRGLPATGSIELQLIVLDVC